MWVNEAELNGEEGVDDDGNGYIDGESCDQRVTRMLLHVEKLRLYACPSF